MAPDSQTRKLFLLLIGITLVISTVSAAQINLNDDTVWLNRDNQSHLEGSIEATGDILLNTSEQGFAVKRSNGTLLTSDFSSVIDSPSTYELELYVNGTKEDTEKVNVKEFKVKIQQDGTGFVGTKMGRTPYTDPVELRLGIEGRNNSEIDKEDITIENFYFTSPEASISDSTDVDAVQHPDDSKDVLSTIYAQIDQDTSSQQERLNLVVEYAHKDSEFSLTKKISPHIYQMRSVPIGSSLSNYIDYQDIGDFSYDVNILKEGKDVNPELYSEDFELHIIEGKNAKPIEACQDEPSQQWLEARTLENSEGDYRLTLGSIPQLNTGTYTFVTCLDPEGDRAEGSKGTVIDSIRVRNGLKLSGRVVDSLNRGIQTEMTLTKEDTVIPVNTDSNGAYYKEIETAGGKNSYDSVQMRFFDRGLSTPDARITVNSVDFASGDNENFAGDQESIKFQYWDNPIVEKKAINPINMMAVKFAYPIAENGHTARMNFNPENVNTDNLEMFRCSSWNFEGTTCLGSWEEIDDGDINVDYGGSAVNFPIDSPYLAEDTGDGDQNILMNAYIVGTSADLVLNGGLSITGPEGGRVATSSEITVEGNINSENENAVEGADVEVSFYQGDTEVSSLDTVQTDITGQFAARGEAPEEPGNYSVKITADKENYNMMERKFDNRFETFVKEGISIETGGTVEVSPGEDVVSEITVQNTGQTDMEDVTLSFEGLDAQYYSVSEAGFDEIPAGDERTTELPVNLPADYCDGGCGDWPSIDISATATNPDGEEFEAETEALQIQISRTTTGQNNSDSSDAGQAAPETDDANNSGSSFTESVSDLENATGEFLASQSSLNLALGLIMVFMMILAGAVKKQDNGGSAGRRSSRTERNGREGRPRVQKPNVAGGSDVEQVKPEKEKKAEDVEKHVESHAEAIASSFSEEDETQERPHVKHLESDEQQESNQDNEINEDEVVEKDGEKKFVCEETGEEFDTETALKLHKKMNGLI